MTLDAIRRLSSIVGTLAPDPRARFTFGIADQTTVP